MKRFRLAGRQDWARMAGLLTCMFLIGGDVVTTGAQQPPAKPAARGDNINSILKRLDDLRKEVEALRGAPEKSSETQKQASPTTTPAAASSPGIPAEWIKTLKWRSIGPAGMGGRI